MGISRDNYTVFSQAFSQPLSSPFVQNLASHSPTDTAPLCSQFPLLTRAQVGLAKISTKQVLMLSTLRMLLREQWEGVCETKTQQELCAYLPYLETAWKKTEAPACRPSQETLWSCCYLWLDKLTLCSLTFTTEYFRNWHLKQNSIHGSPLEGRNTLTCQLSVQKFLQLP